MSAALTTAEPRTRAEFLSAFAGTTQADVAIALQLAETGDQVDRAAHLSLVLFGVGGCSQPFVEHGHTWSSLHDQVMHARRRTGGFAANEAKTLQLMSLAQHSATQTRKADLHAARVAREGRIQALGMNNARP